MADPSKVPAGHDGSPQGVDMATHPTAQKLAARSLEFLREIQNVTPGKDLEKRLNREYGPGNPYYEDFCKYIKQGWKEGWVATGDLDRGIYKRSKVRPITSISRTPTGLADLSTDTASASRQSLHVVSVQDVAWPQGLCAGEVPVQW